MDGGREAPSGTVRFIPQRHEERETDSVTFCSMGGRAVHAR